VNDDFLEFLNANFKELEFKKKKNYWQYTFEQDKNERIRVTEDKDGIHVFAMHQNEENEDIEEEIVDRDSGELFEKLMDRIMDALEVIECSIFNIETNTKTNVDRTPKQIKSGRLKMKKLKKNKKTNDEDIDVYDPSDCDVKSEQIETTKRRSKRINKKSKKEKKERSESVDFEELETVSKRISIRSKNKKKRKRVISISESENEETEEIEVEKPKRKKRRVKNEKAELREMKREFTRLWLDKQYIDAMHLAEDDYSIKKKEINQWIEDLYDFGL